MDTDVEGNPITVLAVTSDEEFAADCQRHLPRYVDADVTTAATVGEAVDVLATAERIDCVVSDHDLPNTDGVAFLEVVRAQSPALPFVLFTSEGDEGVASRAISADVTEYLIKERHADQWERLARLVEDAVAFYRDHGGIVDTETRARTLLDAVRDVIAVVRDGRIEYLNRTGVDLLRADDRTAVAGRPVERILSLEAEATVADRVATVEAGERAVDRAEAWLTRDDGTTLPVEVTATSIEWMDAPAATLVVRDISERKAYESDLELKERAIDEAPVGITVADADESDNPLVYVNEGFERLTGYPAEEALGRNCRFLQGENTDPEPVAAMREAIDADEPVTVELRNYRRDGTEFWNRVTVAPVENDAGEVTHYVGFQEDVTERRESERALRRFKRAVEAAGHAIYITDTDGTIEYVNPAFEETTGFSDEGAVGRNPRILSSGEMSAEYYENLWTTIAGGDVWEEEIRDRRKSGEPYHAHQTIAPVTVEDDVVAYVAIQTDITEQKEREERLRQYERAIDGANELIAAVDDDYRYLFANPSYREFHDIDEREVTETTLPDVVGPDTFEAIEPHVRRALAGNAVRYRMTRTRSDKPDRTFDIRYYPLENEAGEVQGSVATMRDITEQLERETQLVALDRMLRHNLHNELNVVLGHAQLIAERASDDSTRQAATIEAAAERLLEQADKEREIVEFLTELSQPTALDLGEVLEGIAARTETTHPDADVAIEGADGVQLRTIPELERAIEELVENAVVHADQASTAVRVCVEERAESVEITVEDDGPGIPPAERKVIGDDAAIAPLMHSEGMGLWLVKRIVNRAGGTLSFEDTAGDGTVVTLVVPRGGEPRDDGRSERDSPEN